MSKVTKISLIVFMHLVALIIYLYSNTYMHEQFHYSNSRYFGCINATFNLNLKGGQFRCHEYSEFQTKEQRQTMYALDSANEIVSYNMHTFVVFLTVLSITIFIGLIEIFDRGENYEKTDIERITKPIEKP